MYSDSVEDHKRQLCIIFDQLREQSLYLKWSKCELYTIRIDCLGHIIDDKGLHTDGDKLTRIHGWRVPRSYNNIQRFVGLVQYLAAFLLDISAYTGPLMSMTQNGSAFYWQPIHQQCFV